MPDRVARRPRRHALPAQPADNGLFTAETSSSPRLVAAVAIGKTYQAGGHAVTALLSATCSVAPGDRIAIVGPSGSGKSTLLHLLAGLDTPSTGTLCWPALGTRTSLRPRQVAIIFQQPSLLPPLTVVENVELPLLLGGAEPGVARRTALTALGQLDLIGLAARLPEELSGGQAQRVAVARALAHRPRLILADEPTGQLDAATAVQVLDCLLAVMDLTTTALLVATHDALVAARMTTVWRMDHGVLEVAA